MGNEKIDLILKRSKSINYQIDTKCRPIMEMIMMILLPEKYKMQGLIVLHLLALYGIYSIYIVLTS